MPPRKLYLTCLLLTSLPLLAQEPFEIEPLGPFGGDVRSLAVHADRPERFYLGTADGQIYRSDDAGESWRPLTPGLNRRNLVIDNLVFDPRDPDVLYAATWESNSSNGFLFRTRDGGSTWREIDLGNFGSSIRAMAIAPTDPTVMALGITEGVLLSEDSGETWQRISRGYRSLHNVESLAFDPLDSQTLFVGTWRLGWKTENRGKKWVNMHEGMVFDSDMFSLVVSPDDPKTLFASACTGVYKSVDGGGKWAKLINGLPREAKRTRALELDPADSKTLLAGTTAGLYRTRDGGKRFERLIPDVVVNAIAVHPVDRNIVLVATDDIGVVRSVDGGATFSPSNAGFVHRQVVALAESQVVFGTYFAVVRLDRGYGGFFQSSNGGLDWSSYNDGLGDRAGEIRIIRPSSTGQAVFAATSDAIYRGVPGKERWRLVTRIAAADFTVSNDDRRLFAATDKGVLRIDASTGEVARLKLEVYDGAVYTVFADAEETALYVGTDMGVFRSMDGGRHWEIRVKGLPYAKVRALAKTAEVFYCATSEGFFVSVDDTETWTRADVKQDYEVFALSAEASTPDRVYASDSSFGQLFQGSVRGGSLDRMDFDRAPSRVLSLLVTHSGDLLAGTLSDGVYRIRRRHEMSAGK